MKAAVISEMEEGAIGGDMLLLEQSNRVLCHIDD